MKLLDDDFLMNSLTELIRPVKNDANFQHRHVRC